MIGAWSVKAWWVASRGGRGGHGRFWCGVDDDVAVSDGDVTDAEFQESVEQHSSTA